MLFLSAVAAAQTITVEGDGTGNYTTISAAISAAAAGDTIVVGDGTYAAFTLDRALTIQSRNGASATLVDGVGGTAVTATAPAKIDGLSLISRGSVALAMTAGGELSSVIIHDSGVADSSYGGGAALSGGEYAVDSCTFLDNAAVYGGGIYAYGGASLTVTNSSFTGNYAGYGGAIFLDSAAPLWVVSSTFTSNEGSAYGGAIYAGYQNVVTSSGSTFSGNTAAAGWGGAVYVGQEASLASSLDTFAGNESVSGGAVGVYQGALSINASTFDSNLAVNGGALYLDGGPLTADNAVWTGNYASNYGGSTYATNYADVTEHAAYYSDNTAYYYGGGMYTYLGVRVDETSTTFEDETAYYGYGAHIFANYYGSLALADSTLSGGLAYYDGGAIYASSLYDGGVLLQQTTITDNVATYGSGGAAMVAYCSALVVDSTEISKNSAYNYGGGLYVYGYTPTTIADSVLSYNLAEYYSGGGMHWEGAAGTGADLGVSNTEVKGNVSGQSGGGIYAAAADYFDLHSSRIEANVAGSTSFGGGLMLRNPSGWVRVGNNTVGYNSAGYGGGFYTEGNRSLDVDDAWFNNVIVGNSAAVGGGGCVVNDPTAYFANNTLIGNAASDQAGGLCVNQSALVLVNTAIAYTGAGAALHLFDAESAAAITEVHNAYFSNVAGDSGGELSAVNATITADPGFWSWTDNGIDDDSFSLTSVSPLLDAGTPSLLDVDGSISDIGAFGGPNLVAVDADADGFDSATDCDDHDAAVFPGAPDAWYDGVDSDCAGNNDEDQDHDGVLLAEDCDDTNAGIGAACHGAEKPGTNGDPSESCRCNTGASPVMVTALVPLLWIRRRTPPR